MEAFQSLQAASVFKKAEISLETVRTLISENTLTPASVESLLRRYKRGILVLRNTQQRLLRDEEDEEESIDDRKIAETIRTRKVEKLRKARLLEFHEILASLSEYEERVRMMNSECQNNLWFALQENLVYLLDIAEEGDEKRLIASKRMLETKGVVPRRPWRETDEEDDEDLGEEQRRKRRYFKEKALRNYNPCGICGNKERFLHLRPRKTEVDVSKIGLVISYCNHTSCGHAVYLGKLLHSVEMDREWPHENNFKVSLKEEIAAIPEIQKHGELVEYLLKHEDYSRDGLKDVLGVIRLFIANDCSPPVIRDEGFDAISP